MWIWEGNATRVLATHAKEHSGAAAFLQILHKNVKKQSVFVLRHLGQGYQSVAQCISNH